jgi:pimeloyl-ACP methyl ester carboxylesterase
MTDIKRAYILLGGMAGWDGWFDSAGMLILSNMLTKAGVVTTSYIWTNDEHCEQDMLAAQQGIYKDAKYVLIGYSGGGTRATYLNRQYPQLRIDLMVLYDPSPAGEMLPIGDSVKQGWCYHNKDQSMYWPGVGYLGGGILTSYPGQNVPISQYEINENHLAVQGDMSLHTKTLGLVQAL